MNTKSILIFLSGVGLGAVSTYFILKDKYEQQMNEEAENLKVYYEDKYRVDDGEEPEEVDISEVEIKDQNIDGLGGENVKEEPDYNEIVQKLNYNQYSTTVPAPDNAEERVAKKPYQISMDEYNTDTRQVKKIISYFEDDMVCMDNDTKEILTNVAKDIGMDNIELIDTEGNEEIYIRNEVLGIDYNIVAEAGSYEEYLEAGIDE